MALSKHDSTVVLEVIAAFAIIPMIAIAFFLSQIALEMKYPSTSSSKTVAVQETKKIGIDDLDPQFLQALGQNFQQTQAALGQSNQEIGFFMNKVLEKNFSKDEIKDLRAEYEAIIKAQIEKAKAQQAAAQKKASEGNAPNNKIPAASPAAQ